MNFAAKNSQQRSKQFEALAAQVESGNLPFQRKPELARMLAKFLVGTTSPGMAAKADQYSSLAGLKTDALFALLDGFDFLKVLEVAERIMSAKRLKSK